MDGAQPGIVIVGERIDPMELYRLVLVRDIALALLGSGEALP